MSFAIRSNVKRFFLPDQRGTSTLASGSRDPRLPTQY